MAHCANPEVCHHPNCGFWGCRDRKAIAKVWFPLSVPFRERRSMHVCDEHLDSMGKMFGGKN